MAVVLRLKRTGRRNHACFRVAAFDRRQTRDGHAIEELGFYLPRTKDEAQQVKLNKERIEHWLSMGARPTETVAKLLCKHGIGVPAKVEAQA